MSLQVNGRDYFTATEVINEVGVARQTFWRWRQEGRVPAGSRFREKLVIFTPEELQEIKDYSNRMQPIKAVRSHQ